MAPIITKVHHWILSIQSNSNLIQRKYGGETMSNPPIPSKTLNPIQGDPEHKVISLGLQEVVKEGLDAGKGVNKLAKEINESLLVDSKTKISGMAILRWSKKYYTEDDKESTEHAINLYSHYIEMLNQLSKQMDIQSVCIDELSKASEDSVDDIISHSRALNAAMMAYEKIAARKQVILGTISSIQEKVYSYMAASEVVRITLQAVKDKDQEIYNDIMVRLKENAEYMELFRKISPEK
jgi:hypothetical protein